MATHYPSYPLKKLPPYQRAKHESHARPPSLTPNQSHRRSSWTTMASPLLKSHSQLAAATALHSVRRADRCPATIHVSFVLIQVLVSYMFGLFPVGSDFIYMLDVCVQLGKFHDHGLRSGRSKVHDHLLILKREK